MILREFAPDDAEALTEFLHRAYAELGELGLNFTAVDQSAETTLRRAGGGYCLLAVDGDDIIGTVTMSVPSESLRQMTDAATAPDLAWLNQLATDPGRRHEGIARQLWMAGSAWARAAGRTSVGVDTAEPATHLIDLYRGWGFERVATIHWPGKTYDSVVMVRSL